MGTLHFHNIIRRKHQQVVEHKLDGCMCEFVFSDRIAEQRLVWQHIDAAWLHRMLSLGCNYDWITVWILRGLLGCGE